MPHADTLTTMFRHHLWANLELLAVCANLTDEQLNSQIVGGYGSIGDTWQHIVSAERGYFSRISTGQQYRRPEHAALLTMAEMAESLRETGAGLIEWAPRVKAEDLVQIDWDGTLRNVPKAILLTQTINHATEHRAQIMTILTQLGIEPPELDGWMYFDQIAD